MADREREQVEDLWAPARTADTVASRLDEGLLARIDALIAEARDG